ncbi:MAG: DUF4168 domain-containing protein [Bacteroidota bacterium]|uniref:DUF4168 domain-containing protein n=1 Tax=Algoriphagus faecimaris TaxID=686796 RepID=A0A1G6XPH2_9BACT|nr:DUF4168 domain-containing protein [Algoriphagus faecimaris]SDD80050.1 protein of unknown function [Algoriphagus faecimaris]
MNFKTRIKSLTVFVFSFAFLAASAFAQQMTPPQAPIQDDFSDSEIETFVKINKEIMPVQEKVQQDMVKSIQEKGMEVPRFQELAQAQSAGTLREVTEDLDEISKFNEIGQEVMKLQQDMQVEVQEIIQKSEMAPEKFEAIYMAYNSSPKVKEKVDKLLQEDQ